MSITRALHRSVRDTPQDTATQCSGRERSFAEHADRIARLASAFRALGVVPGNRLAILSANSDRYLEFLLGCSWMGAVFNPLNTRWSAAELEYGLNDAGSRVLAVDDTFVPIADRLRAACPSLERLIYLGDGECPPGMESYEALIAGNEPIEDVAVDEAEIAGLFYTGGTTGISRGVILSHQNLLESALGSIATADILVPGPVLHVAPLFHLAGIWPWLLQLEAGGTQVILPAFAPDQIVQLINRLDVANMFLVPTMMQRFVEYIASSGAEVPTLRTMQYAGSPMPEVVLDQLQAVLPDVALTQVYGMTELAPVATLLLPSDHAGEPRRSAGRAAVHSKVRVVDSVDRDLPIGGIGEILVQGENVMLGYWNRPGETEATLRGGWMHTGDAGRLDEEGFLYVVDRIKDVIVSGGENVYSVEVENAIMSLPGVVNCAVIGLPDEQWGERVHAVLVLEPGASVSLETVRAHVGERIARYKSPRSIETVEALPISAAGKVLKRELRLAAVNAGADG